MLCYVMLCYVMLCYVMLCYVMLRYVWFVMICYRTLRYVALRYVMLCTNQTYCRLPLLLIISSSDVIPPSDFTSSIFMRIASFILKTEIKNNVFMTTMDTYATVNSTWSILI